MTQPRITTIQQLNDYLCGALQLEHATIPPYLTALYSLRPGSNSDALHIVRVVVVEEMLHLSLVANVMNAVGGTPDLTQPGFVPRYPAYLPDGEQDFQVDLQPFSKDAVSTFLKIERPAQAPDEKSRLVLRSRPHQQLLAASPEEPGMQYYSIGEFYEEIARGVRYLHKQYAEHGRQLFVGDPSRQVTPDWETPAPNMVGDVLRFLEGVPSRQVGVCIDSAHVVLGSSGPEAFKQQVLRVAEEDRLNYAQVSAPDRGAVRDSWIPWSAFLGAILPRYQGPLLIEIFNAIPAFLNSLHLTRRKFWIPGEDEPVTG